MLYMNKLIAFVIDEAHCVTQWCVCMCVCVCVCVCLWQIVLYIWVCLSISFLIIGAALSLYFAIPLKHFMQTNQR